jgi:hypothetical protein
VDPETEPGTVPGERLTGTRLVSGEVASSGTFFFLKTYCLPLMELPENIFQREKNFLIFLKFYKIHGSLPGKKIFNDMSPKSGPVSL